MAEVLTTAVRQALLDWRGEQPLREYLANGVYTADGSIDASGGEEPEAL